MEEWKAELLEILKETGLSDGRPPWAVELQKNYSGPDQPYDYYRFLHQVARKYRPAITVEIGTAQGVSAAALATGNPDGLVITLDVLPNGRDNLSGIRNIEARLELSQEFKFEERCPGKTIDLLYIDGDHSYESVRDEFALYLGRMSPGGLIIMDDILYPGAWLAWGEILNPKFELPLPGHTSGFGAVKV